MNEYKGFKCDQYESIYDKQGFFVGKLNGESLKDWVDEFLQGLEEGRYDE